MVRFCFMLIVTSSVTAPPPPLKCCASAASHPARTLVDRMAAVAAVSATSPAVRAHMDPDDAVMIGNALDVFARWLTEQRQGSLEVIRDTGITLG